MRGRLCVLPVQMKTSPQFCSRPRTQTQSSNVFFLRLCRAGKGLGLRPLLTYRGRNVPLGVLHVKHERKPRVLIPLADQDGTGSELLFGR